MKKNQIKIGMKIREDGIGILKEMNVKEDHDRVMDIIRKDKRTSEKNEVQRLVTEITAIGLLMSTVGGVIFTDMLENVENNIEAIMKLVKFIDHVTKWNNIAIVYVGDNTMDPNVKREVAIFMSEVDPDGGL